MLHPKFQDRHIHNATGYSCTNESLATIIEMVGQKRPMRAGAIGSGGEVALGAILPQTTHQLVVVDHSYRSVVVFWLKFLILHEMSAKGFRDLICNGGKPAVMNEVVKLADNLPDYLQKWMVSQSYATKKEWLQSYFFDDFSNMQRQWRDVSVNRLLRAAKKLELVHLIHGDLPSDVKEFGTFDLLYISNMTGHWSRSGFYPSLNHLAPIVKKGGYVLMTAGEEKADSDTWEIQTFSNKTPSYGESWRYNVLTKK